jgi:hypothetical protein
VPPDRRRLLLIGVLVLLVVVAGWTYFGSGSAPPPTPAAAGASAAGRRQNQAAKGAEPLPEAEAVRLSSLSQSRDEPSSATRNPFKFRREAPGGGTATEKPPVFQPVQPSDVTAPAGPPPPPPIPLKFIGVLEKTDGNRWAVLSVGEGRAPLHGKEGDIIDGRYRILKIGNESIDLAYLDGRGRQTIRLTGQ